MNTSPIELAQWDSDFFAIKIARVRTLPHTLAEMKIILALCDAEQIDCIYALAPADAIEVHWLLEGGGFVMRDVRLQLGRQTEHVEVADTIRPARMADLPALEAIAASAYTSTRFARDPGFPRDAVSRFYTVWIRNSYNGFADAILVEGSEGSPMGFVTLRVEADRASIGLTGVSQEARSKGVGGRLIKAALAWAHDRKLTDIQVVTQGHNVAAQRLYQRSGFTSQTAQIWYHYWPKHRRPDVRQGDR